MTESGVQFFAFAAQRLTAGAVSAIFGFNVVAGVAVRVVVVHVAFYRVPG